MEAAEASEAQNEREISPPEDIGYRAGSITPLYPTAPGTQMVVVQATPPPESDPLDRLLVGAQEHLVDHSLKPLQRRRYDDAIVFGPLAVGIHRVRGRPSA
jgi:hypothetical protein